MSFLADIFIYSVVSIVDLVSYVIFQVLCALMLAAYHVLKIPSFVLFKLLKALLLTVPDILDSLVNTIANIILSILTTSGNLAYYTVKGFILHIVVTILLDLLRHLQTAVYELSTLMAAFAMNAGKLTSLSVYNVWKNFSRAVYEFTQNM